MRTSITFAFILIAWCCATTAFAQVSSTFDTDADGWTFSDAVVHDPSGYISSTYSASATSSTQRWSAPAKFRGNHVVKSAGMNLKFDLQQSVAGTSSNTNGDVRIESPGFTLVYSFPDKPATAPGWTTYELKLDETAGWRINSTSGSLATRSQVMNAITNITAIEIRASYATQNPYTAAIDNVILEERTLVAPPSITAFSPVSGDVGSTVTITGANFSPIAGDNVVYFGSTRATILSASSAEVVVSVPAGAAFAPVTLVNTANGLSARSQYQFTPTFPDGGRLIRASFDPRADIMLTTPGNEPTGLSLNDLDGDGWNDIVVSESGNVVSIYRNLGGGGDLGAASFASPLTLAGGGNSPSLRIQDLDGDGQPDIAAEYSSGSVTYFATFRNTSTPGSIVFEAVELWYGPVYSGALSHVVDVDGDGRPDLIGQHGNGSVSPDFWIAENISTPGDIEFGGSRSYFGGNTLDAGAGVTAGDLDNDGKPEIIVVHSFGGQFQIIKNNSFPGAISFGTPFAITEGVSGQIQVFDINGDGNLDLTWKKGSSNDDINVRINSNNDAVLDATDFATEVMFNSDLFNYGAMAFSDLNGDGKADIFATDGTYLGVYENVFSGGTFNSSAYVEAYLHQGTGISTYPDFSTAADLNGDGRPDIVTAITNITPSRLVVYENKNTHRPAISVSTVFPLKGVPGSEVTITGDNFSTVPSENLVRFGSINASVQSVSETQLVAIVPAGATTGYVSVSRDGLSSRYHLPFVATFSMGVDFTDTHFSTPISFTLAGADYDVEVADLNNDGKADVVAEATAGRGYAFMNTHTSGAITTGSLTPDDTTSSSAQNVRLVDLDADGYEDIVSINGLYRNTSNGVEIKFEPLTSTSTGGNNGFGDFNHDGKTDIVGVNSSVVVVTENRTTPGNYSTASPMQSFEGYNYNKSAANGGSAAGDFDNDGLMDFAATNPGVDNVTIWRNTGSYRVTTTQFSEQPAIPVGDNPGRLYASDVDVDGKIDLVLYYSAATTSQFITVLHNQSTVGNISFTRVDFDLGSVGTTATVNDLDGDGRPEIIVASEAANRFSIFKNTSVPGAITTGSFATPFHSAITAPRGVTSGDLNGDSKPEIFVTRAAGVLEVFENLVPNAMITISSQPADTTGCLGNNATFSVTAEGTSNMAYQWQKYDSITSAYVDLVNGGYYNGIASTTLTVLDLSTSDAGNYRIRISGDYVADQFSDDGQLIVAATPSDPSSSPVSVCPGMQATLTASGAAEGFYRWYADVTDASLIEGQVTSEYITPPVGSDTTYYVSAHNGSCESNRIPVVVSLFDVPVKPAIEASSGLTFCDGGSVTLSAPAGFSYQWSNGETTREITATVSDDYSVTVTNGDGCSSEPSNAATVRVHANPPVPEIISSGGNLLCAGESLTLSAPEGYSYQWSTTASTREITVTDSGDYSVEITDNNGCTVTSEIFNIAVESCNQPPVIGTTEATAVLGNTVTIDLLALLSDPDNNIDLSSLSIVTMPMSGAQASVDENATLHLDYGDVSFLGTDQLTIEVCDTESSCVQQVLYIEVTGDIVIYTGLSPNADGKNDFWLIRFIDLIEETRDNEVKIFNRWGDLVWEGTDYDNQNVVFTGLNKNGTELPSGAYFYHVNFSGRKSLNGYISLRR